MQAKLSSGLPQHVLPAVNKQAPSLLWSAMAAPNRISIVMITRLIEQGKGQQDQQKEPTTAPAWTIQHE